MAGSYTTFPQGCKRWVDSITRRSSCPLNPAHRWEATYRVEAHSSRPQPLPRPCYQQLGHGFAEDYPHLRTPRSGIPNGGLQSFQPHSVQPARESHVQSGHLWTIDLRSEACRWNLRRTANPVRHETHILKAFDIEGSQAGGLLASRRNFAARGVPAKARIRSQDRPYMGVAGWRVSFADPTR